MTAMSGGDPKALQDELVGAEARLVEIDSEYVTIVLAYAEHGSDLIAHFERILTSRQIRDCRSL